jgi:hypothetical protein
MKQYRIAILIAVLIMSSCKLQNENNTEVITQLVNDVETIVNKYDKNVLSALDNKKYDYIDIISKVAMDSTNSKINELKSLDASIKHLVLRSAAIAYVEALQDIILAERTYANMTDTTSLTTAKEMDHLNLNAINRADSVRVDYIQKLNASRKK